MMNHVSVIATLTHFLLLERTPYHSFGKLTYVSSVLVKQIDTKAHLPHQHRWQICSTVTCGLMYPPNETLNTQEAFLLFLLLSCFCRCLFFLHGVLFSLRKNPPNSSENITVVIGTQEKKPVTPFLSFILCLCLKS